MMSSGLRVDYLGASMMLTAAAFAEEHRARDHRVSHHERLDELSLTTPPDVVFHHPLDRTAGGLVPTCALSQRLPDHVLLVPIFSDFGPSNEMFVHHALRGNCHPKMLLHWIGADRRTPTSVLDQVEAALEGTGGIDFTGSFPRSLDVTGADLGEVMASRERFGRLLYMAASSRSWATWGDLTRILALGDGVVRNTNGELGSVLKEARIIPADSRWTAQGFTRFVTEYRSFIVAYGQFHLDYDPPLEPFWWCAGPVHEAS